MSRPSLHAALAPLEMLLGKWQSTQARAFYPTMTTLAYTDLVEFSHEGQPLLNYSSFARHGEQGHAMHQERGFLRINPDTNQLAFMVAHNLGLAEVSEGQVEGNKVVLESTQLAGMSFQKGNPVTKLHRVLEVLDPNTLHIIVSMATPKTPLQEHMKIAYKRVE